MARIIKANAVKSKAKAKSPREESSKNVVAEKRAQMRVVNPSKASSSKAKEAPKAAAPSTTGEKSAEKKVSQRLIETIQKRQQAKGGAVGRVPGRRGRRPKALAEYVPNNNEEENVSAESDFEGLEYDTGIRVKEGRDEYGFSMDRLEEFDEELNFDW